MMRRIDAGPDLRRELRPDVRSSAGEFRPAPGLAGPFRQTAIGALLPARYPSDLPPPERQEVEVRANGAPETLGVLLTPAPTGRTPASGRLILLHGLGGTAGSRYMVRTTREAHGRGWAVARVNFRGADPANPGGPNFHNAERTEDIAACLTQIRWGRGVEDSPLAVAGFSLGGAVLLKYLGGCGARTAVSAAAAVCAPVDLAASLEALERPENWIYHRYFVRRMRAQLRPKLEAHKGSVPRLASWMNTVRALDTVYTAPDAGYASAEAYYARASSLPVLPRIAVRCLLLSSRDDPFVPAVPVERLSLPESSPLRTLVTNAGGHVGFLERRGLWISFWAARTVLDWLERF